MRLGGAERDLEIFEAKPVTPQTTRARLRGEFIRKAQEKRRDFTVDWMHLKLNERAQRTVLPLGRRMRRQTHRQHVTPGTPGAGAATRRPVGDRAAGQGPQARPAGALAPDESAHHQRCAD
ncbi:proteasome accessory factor PafA2 family protein [Actinomadura barringtoniae]|uniref:proteasome accessory factor PafA2 family protein n=1 Tax=Actinomadura barringtoniae TaxID=1427535 RepID=UPI0035588F01